MYTENFRTTVLIDPIRRGADSLKIISGYATHTMVSWHIDAIAQEGLPPINIALVVGMCPHDGIGLSVHEGFNALVSRNGTPGQSNFTCQYVTSGTPVHSKLYLWERAGSPFCAFVGSANYTQTAFSARRRELLQPCDPQEALAYFENIEASATYCNHAEIEEMVVIATTHPILDSEEAPLVSLRGAGVKLVTLSLLTSRGNVGHGSGINWGHRRNGTRREPNQMYISLPAEDSRSGFFPLGNEHFSVVTDDNVHLILSVQQQGNKAITTPLNNSQLGEYFRGRIGVPNGAFVTKQDLLNYGRTDVTFYKLDDEQYFMDFSV